MKLTIWHNKSCSTSNKVLDYLRVQNYLLEIRNYLADPPSEHELNEVIDKMHGNNYLSLLRTKDRVFQEKYMGKDLTKWEWIQAMHENPTIIERPIVISDSRAWVARPFDQWVANFEQS